MFRRGELDGPDALFDLAVPAAAEPKEPLGKRRRVARTGRPKKQRNAVPARRSPVGRPGSDLDPDQLAAAEADGPLMIVAGPGTGKTHTLTHRIARQVRAVWGPPGSCLAITFTRRAAEEMHGPAGRPAARPGGRRVTVTTFHGLGLMILREHHELAGLASRLPRGRRRGTARGRRRARRDRRARASGCSPTRRATRPPGRRWPRPSAARDLVDFDGLIELPAALLAAEPEVAESLRERWPLISVDEYQDIDAAQYRLLRLLAGDGSGLTVIGDPDQAIYGFRGADVGVFLRFGSDYPGAVTRELTRNYRSSRAIVGGALQAIAPSSLVRGRVLRPRPGRSHVAGGTRRKPPP